MSKMSNKNELLGLPLWILLSFIFVNLVVFGFWLRNEETKKNIRNEDHWETYKSDQLDIQFKHPTVFLIEESDEYIRVYSPPVVCMASNQIAGKTEKISASEINIEFLQYQVDPLSNYSEVWQEVFDYKLIGDYGEGIDGKRIIDHKGAYYFYQGAEMIFARKIHLVRQSPTKALKITVNTPSLVYDCERPLDQYSQEKIGYDINDKILSTITFLSI